MFIINSDITKINIKLHDVTVYTGLCSHGYKQTDYSCYVV